MHGYSDGLKDYVMLMENVNYDPPLADGKKRFARGFRFVAHNLQEATYRRRLKDFRKGRTSQGDGV